MPMKLIFVLLLKHETLSFLVIFVLMTCILLQVSPTMSCDRAVAVMLNSISCHLMRRSDAEFYIVPSRASQ